MIDYGYQIAAGSLMVQEMLAKAMDVVYGMPETMDVDYAITESSERQSLPRTARKIEGFKDIPKGWHFGEGVVFKQEIINLTLELFEHAYRKLNFKKTDAFPGLNGEIMLTVYHHHHFLELTVEPDESVTFCREDDGDEVCDVEGLTFEEAKKRLQDFGDEIWKQSDCCRQNTLTAPADVLLA